ncbi:hypothetical protein CFOL_v3_03095 [Cephalotus follicularis]|uniref:UBN2_3 domain-containing protein n=1 Tax=Cephalotus follicularis TaxID=3775 RepID=A0A1Q3AV95_CEPFO|nr:hypothetical protein CFOL_v3_03095 [Cephalotus follicularis]
MTVAQYFAKLNTLWQELNFYQDFQPECPVDTTKFQKWVDKERVFDFLAGLTLESDQTRSQILGRDHFLSLRQAYACVQKEESRRIAMMLSNTQGRSTFVANPTQKAEETMDRDQIKCIVVVKQDTQRGLAGNYMVGPSEEEEENVWDLLDHKLIFQKLLSSFLIQMLAIYLRKKYKLSNSLCLS